MTNCHTKKSHFPRTVTLIDYGDVETKKYYKGKARPGSPTRLSNPHPEGFTYLVIPSQEKKYAHWKPNLERQRQKHPGQWQQIHYVNFTCKHPLKFASSSDRSVPNIQFTEDTTKRCDYICPSRFPTLARDKSKPLIVGNPTTQGAVGILPRSVVNPYVPVIDK